MNQLDKAKEAVKHLKDDGNTNHSLYAISECLLSIAISLDEKNKLDRETRAKDEERLDKGYDQSERMIKKVEALQEAQGKNNEPMRNISDKTVGTVKVSTTY